MSIREHVRIMKEQSPRVAASPLSMRDLALRKVREALVYNKESIFAANQEDLARADQEGIAPAVRKRLKFDEHKLSDVLAGIDSLLSLPDPVGRVTLDRQLDEGLELKRVTVPIGVIGVIFEARPDALVQISSLCIKSGNCAVLKGGRETASTNKALFDLIHKAAVSAGLPEGCLLQASAHSEIDELLQCDDCVDLLIPRGSNRFVRYIMENTKIPVMGHSDGICSIYVDEYADFDKAIPIIVDAKTQYTAACNAAETLLVNRKIAPSFLPKAAKELAKAGVRLRGTEEAAEILERAYAEQNARKTPSRRAMTSADLAASVSADQAASVSADQAASVSADQAAQTPDGRIRSEDILKEDSDFRHEYLDLILAVKLVGSVEEAAAHINRYGSHHTDSIITENDEAGERFMSLVDSAGVYRNCSTRFADGFRYGFGAEVGISTSKLHARGPVGLDGLVTYKYRLYGSGQIVGNYASGKKSFHFKDLG